MQGAKVIAEFRNLMTYGERVPLGALRGEPLPKEGERRTGQPGLGTEGHTQQGRMK